jgi:exodeoxyribonuclease VII small subunit
MAKKHSAPAVEADSAPEDLDLTFEQAFQQLEDIVVRMEQGDLPLDQSLELHARGQRLAEFCARLLDTAELKVKEIGD